MSNTFAQAHHADPVLEVAIRAATESVRSAIKESIDLVFVFVAGYSREEFDEQVSRVKELTGARIVLGCTCETVVGGAFELEQVSAVTVWAAKLPEATMVPMHLEYSRLTGESAITGWPNECDGEWPEDSILILLAEPFAFPMDVLLERFNEDRPGVRIVGGMTSGAHAPGEARLLLGEDSYSEGVVAVRISGVPVRTIVSQGCRPIGKPMVITKSERNIIETIGGKRAFTVLQELFETLPTKEKSMVQNGLQLGRVINEYQESFEYGDFLIRNVIGIDSDNDSIAVGDYMRVGQTVQFHIRDADSASYELQQMLTKTVDHELFGGALLFTCNGRGLNLFPDPNHDASTIQAKSPCALAGFFAAGEVGPVGNRNFLHGFTASVVLFE